MDRLSCVLGLSASLSFLSACASSGPIQSDERIGHQAHEAYVSAINSNSIDTLLGMLTDDVVYMSPHEPRLVGKAAVRAWGKGYLDAFHIHWEKTTLEFVVCGEWAFEQYAYRATDTPRDGSEVLHDTGKGINIYHHDADGVWRVARDAWNSDLPIPTE